MVIIQMMTEQGFYTWKAMSIEMVYQGFINGDIKSARIGATMAYMLLSFDLWDIKSKDFALNLGTVFYIHDIKFNEWDKRSEFFDYFAQQLQRVSAICHSTKSLDDFYEEPGGEILKLYIKSLEQRYILGKCDSAESILNQLHELMDDDDEDMKDEPKETNDPKS